MANMEETTRLIPPGDDTATTGPGKLIPRCGRKFHLFHPKQNPLHWQDSVFQRGPGAESAIGPLQCPFREAVNSPEKRP